MAGDWIKWSKGLPDKPEVLRIGATLGLVRAEVVLRLMKFWEWCDDNISKDSICENGSAFVTLSPRDGDNVAFIDDLVRTPGFADSLAAVHWLRCRAGRIELPNFGRHNGETAKTRARNSKNQKQKRGPKDGEESPQTEDEPAKPVTKMSPSRGDKTVTRGEESREENKTKDKDPLNPPSGDTPPEPDPELEFVAAWNGTKGATPVRGARLLPKRLTAFKARIRDPAWDWRAALAKFPLKLFASDPNGWQPEMDWFLRPGTVTSILEGKYDWAKKGGGGGLFAGPGTNYDPNAAEDPEHGRL